MATSRRVVTSKPKKKITGSTRVSELLDSDALDENIDSAFGVKGRTIDEVVGRHLDDDDEDEDVPFGNDAVPSDDDDPSMRSKPTLGTVVVSDDAPDLSNGTVSTLEDLVGMYTFDGTGRYYIQVIRRKPKSYGGYQCDGVQRPIITNITQREFTEQYGGGEYSLRVYGPPRRGGLIDPSTGTIKPKALTEAITYVVPYDASGVFGIPPNPESSLPEEEPMTEMEPSRPALFRRPATPSDASIHKSNLEDNFRRESIASDVAAKGEVARAEVERDKIKAESDAQRRALDVLARQADKATAATPGVDIGSLLAGLSEIMKSQSPRDNSSAHLLESARKEVERAIEQRAEEIQRITAAHEQERERLREMARQDLERAHQAHAAELLVVKREIQVERENGQNQVRQIEERMHRELESARNESSRTIESMRAEHARMIDQLQRESDRRVADTERVMRIQIETEKGAHDREINTMKSGFDGRLHTDKTLLEERLRILTTELAAERTKNENLQADLREKEDLAGQINKFAATASALGFSKAEGGSEEGAEPERNWKYYTAELAKDLIPKLPELLQTAGTIVNARAAAKTAAAQPPAQTHPIAAFASPIAQAPLQSLPFATGGSDLSGASRLNIAPLPVTASMYPPPVMQPVTPVQQQLPPQVQPMPMMQPQMQPMQPVPQNEAMVPLGDAPADPQQQPTPTASQAADPQAISPEEEQQILQFRGEIEKAIAAKMTPPQFVEEMKKAFGVDTVRQVANTLDPNKIISVIQRSPEAAGSVLRTFPGKKWLRTMISKAREVK